MTPNFKITYTFVSTRADGDDYTRSIYIHAANYKAAMAMARTIGFTNYGARFNDNCVDWTAAPYAPNATSRFFR
jgi:hypothetical protein